MITSRSIPALRLACAAPPLRITLDRTATLCLYSQSSGLRSPIVMARRKSFLRVGSGRSLAPTVPGQSSPLRHSRRSGDPDNCKPRDCCDARDDADDLEEGCHLVGDRSSHPWSRVRVWALRSFGRTQPRRVSPGDSLSNREHAISASSSRHVDGEPQTLAFGKGKRGTLRRLIPPRGQRCGIDDIPGTEPFRLRLGDEVFLV
jgi:hypothetical protein